MILQIPLKRIDKISIPLTVLTQDNQKRFQDAIERAVPQID